MNNRQAIADRVEIEALRGEYTDALMTRDWDRLASLFAHDGAVRMPHVPAELAGRREIRAGIERLQALLDYFVQTTHPGTIRLDGDTAAGRAYISELIRFRDGSSHLNYAVYHDRYQRTPDGWKFTERVYEISYLDTTPLAGSAPHAAGAPANANPPAESTSSAKERRDPWLHHGPPAPRVPVRCTGRLPAWRRPIRPARPGATSASGPPATPGFPWSASEWLP